MSLHVTGCTQLCTESQDGREGNILPIRTPSGPARPSRLHQLQAWITARGGHVTPGHGPRALPHRRLCLSGSRRRAGRLGGDGEGTGQGLPGGGGGGGGKPELQRSPRHALPSLWLGFAPSPSWVGGCSSSVPAAGTAEQHEGAPDGCHVCDGQCCSPWGRDLGAWGTLAQHTHVETVEQRTRCCR